MEFSFGKDNKKQLDNILFLPPIIKKVIEICKNLPDGKMLFMEDITPKIGCTLSALKSVARLTPNEYSTVGPCELEDLTTPSNTITRKRRVFGNPKTIEAWKQWLAKKKHL